MASKCSPKRIILLSIMSMCRKDVSGGDSKMIGSKDSLIWRFLGRVFLFLLFILLATARILCNSSDNCIQFFDDFLHRWSIIRTLCP